MRRGIRSVAAPRLVERSAGGCLSVRRGSPRFRRGTRYMFHALGAASGVLTDGVR